MIAHLDCSSGVSGDKLLGAVLDAGEAAGVFSAGVLQSVLDGLVGEGRVIVSRSVSHGIAAVGVRVEATGQAHGRHWRDIRALLEAAQIPARAKRKALETFELIARAEARVHGTTPDDVHFHEVGALDSIMDVVGVCVGLDALGVESLTSSAIATGWGHVTAAHGLLPVPAPATALLLEGVLTQPGQARPAGPGARGAADSDTGPSSADPGRTAPDTSAPGELTTPTGAALVKAWATGYGPAPAMTPRLVGYGMGTRDIGSPNVCRIIIGDPAPTSPTLHANDVCLLEANLDHVTPETVAFAAEQLLAEGALDAWTVPLVMKKGRPGLLLSALVDAKQAEGFAARMAALTGTLGVRVSSQARLIAERRSETISTPWGNVGVKIGPLGGDADVVRPEYEDVARIARQTSQPFGEVERELVRLAREQLA